MQRQSFYSMQARKMVLHTTVPNNRPRRAADGNMTLFGCNDPPVLIRTGAVLMMTGSLRTDGSTGPLISETPFFKKANYNFFQN